LRQAMFSYQDKILKPHQYSEQLF